MPVSLGGTHARNRAPVPVVSARGPGRWRPVRRRTAALGAAALGAALFAALASPALAASAQAAHRHFGFGGNERAVLVQSDNIAGNEVIAYHRSPSGAPNEAGAYPSSSRFTGAGSVTGTPETHDKAPAASNPPG